MASLRQGEPSVRSPDAEASISNIYSQLEQKERDLILAAELGKALLEQNNKLKEEQDQMQFSFSEKLEKLQQERHALQKKLEVLEGEHDSRVQDLVEEVGALQHRLVKQRATNKHSEKEKQDAIEELVEQNQRLASELKQTAEEKQELEFHVGNLENQVRAATVANQIDPALVDKLESKVRELEFRKSELVQALDQLASERDSLVVNMEEGNRRALLLERQVRELEHQVYVQEVQLSELRRTHATTLHDLEELRLSEALSSVYMNRGQGQGPSLFDELGAASPDWEGKLLSSMGEENKQEDDEDSLAGDDENPLQQRCQKLQKAMNTIQVHIVQLTQNLHSWRHSESDADAPSTSGAKPLMSPEDSSSDVEPEDVMVRLQELQDLLEDIMNERNLQHPPPSPLPGQEAQLQHLQNHVSSLRSELERTQTVVDGLQTEIKQQNQLMVDKDKKIKRLSVKLEYRKSMPDPESLFAKYRELEDATALSFLQEISQEERQAKQSSSNPTSDSMSDVSTDSLDTTLCMEHEEEIHRLTEERDSAVKRREDAEVQLVHAQLAMDELDGQVVGAVHQQLEIAKQINNWEVDLHDLLDERLRKQMRRHEGGKKGKKLLGKTPRKRIGHLK